VAFFESGIVQVNAAVGTISSLIWNPSNTSTTTFGALGSVSASAVLKDVTVINQGTTSVYIASGSIASSTPTLGVLLPVGGQLTIQGYSGTVGTAGSLWAQAGSITAGLTGAVAVGMASVASVV
jgi:hypothetical protein